MNKELISKLRKQSKVDPKEIVKALANTNDAKIVEHWLDQFAEQIVRECMEQVWYTREDGINGNVSQVIKDRIKQHFGVEE